MAYRGAHNNRWSHSRPLRGLPRPRRPRFEVFQLFELLDSRALDVSWADTTAGRSDRKLHPIAERASSSERPPVESALSTRARAGLGSGDQLGGRSWTEFCTGPRRRFVRLPGARREYVILVD